MADETSKNPAPAGAAADEIKTDATGGADKQWPDEAKILPDTYLKDDAK